MDETVYCDDCKCRDCEGNRELENGGTCSHCFCCISEEKAMDVCPEHKE